MAKTMSSLVVGLDINNRKFDFYVPSTSDGSNMTHDVISYRDKQLDKNFFASFSEKLENYIQEKLLPRPVGVTLVLPDNVVFSDTLSLLNLGWRTAKPSLNTSITRLYPNNADLKIDTFLAHQNKQHCFYSLTGGKKELISAFSEACSKVNAVLEKVTFASSTTVTAIGDRNSKLRSQTYLFLDIKSEFTRVIFVYKGRPIGYTSLPFGREVLEKSHVVEEDMLFDHAVADLAVLNAREKARMKALTMMNASESVQNDLGENEEEEDSFNSPDANQQPINSSDPLVKILPKKMPRKLPKFMQRPQPSSFQEVQYENFRVFMKWALCFIFGNDQLKEFATPEEVYVKLPETYDFLYEMANREAEENGVKFLSAEIDDGSDVAANLELYGAGLNKKSPGLICF